MQIKQRQEGFTLFELLLVLVVTAGIIYGAIRFVQMQTLQMQINRAVFQIKEILGGVLIYYTNYNTWPTSITDLQNLQILVASYSSVIYSPWGTTYSLGSPTSTSISVTLPLPNMRGGAEIAQTIAGQLPYATWTGGSSPQVTATVLAPPSIVTNAQAVTFAGVYNHGGCVPVPTCPVDPSGVQLTPQISVAPVSVSGVANSYSNAPVYPITSFTAYATGSSGSSNVPTTTKPADCGNGTYGPGGGSDCAKADRNGGAASAYWRVCLQVITVEGAVASVNSTAWGNMVKLFAITQCVPAFATVPSGNVINPVNNGPGYNYNFYSN